MSFFSKTYYIYIFLQILIRYAGSCVCCEFHPGSRIPGKFQLVPQCVGRVVLSFPSCATSLPEIAWEQLQILWGNHAYHCAIC